MAMHQKAYRLSDRSSYGSTTSKQDYPDNCSFPIGLNRCWPRWHLLPVQASILLRCNLILGLASPCKHSVSGQTSQPEVKKSHMRLLAIPRLTCLICAY